LAVEEVIKEKNWQGTDAEYAELISHAAAASDAQPENIRYSYWLGIYRWSQVCLALDPDFGTLPEESMPAVYDIVAQLHKARICCPTYGPTYSTLGQIEKTALNDEDGGNENIKKGFRLAPNNPIACLAAGTLDIDQGNVDISFEKFDKAVKLKPGLFKGLANLYALQVDRPDLALALAGDNIHRLNYAAKILESAGDNKELIEQIQIKRTDLLKEKCLQPDASASDFITLANVYHKQQNVELAIEYYHRALALDYGQVDWRFRLAKTLVEAEKIPEAMDEAKICLRLRPQFKAAKKLVEDLSIHPKMLEQ
jgi:tetratricopeptide (TPR) repeat protein